MGHAIYAQPSNTGKVSLDINSKNEKQEYDKYRICLVWHTEALARQRKLPSLKKLLKYARKKPTSKPSKGDAILKAMAAEKGVIIK